MGGRVYKTVDDVAEILVNICIHIYLVDRRTPYNSISV